MGVRRRRARVSREILGPVPRNALLSCSWMAGRVFLPWIRVPLLIFLTEGSEEHPKERKFGCLSILMVFRRGFDRCQREKPFASRLEFYSGKKKISC